VLRLHRLVLVLLSVGCSSTSPGGPPASTEDAGEIDPGAGGAGGGGSGGAGGQGGVVETQLDAALPSADAAPVGADTAPTVADTAGPALPADAGDSPAASAGCGGPSKPGGVFDITAGASTTNYRLILPKGYDGKKPYPVVFYLHGRGNGIEGQGNLNTDVAAADLGLVVYPKSFGGSGWEVPNRDKPEENLALLGALLEHLKQDYCVNPRKVIMTGFSSGCWFTSRLACTMKAQLAGVVAAGCALDPMGKCMDKIPVTFIIGRGDPRFGDAAMTADFYRSRNACMMTRAAGKVAPCEDYQGCAAGFPTAFCVHPGGHMWPGFASKTVVELLSRL
jgi:polyhydroxybutyrate depolymerase